ncbi:hypothetical protein SPRG_02077 [Saprolegnia parasitica CBS 223.65]|uniref:Uncharacterized protein n=1 Tax=Saprolegnia parasitica (strain CBS 223.65) TaxID=695850 RepID=A0A067CS04_SAPPC|nr:hypothetical protein SPRG_02077 [Saprolegnia parasitica CBS 223.65]KDO33268.1 hypothetical protein SPRG_02077 [Saprolegnia parasitica CBS 223.65]|eukprot:XP_012196024.1 hypothetical protein SPRG_02077 [Saprolegnia parasitica CBS 223.65]
MAIPLHPRCASAYFHMLIGDAKDLPMRVAAFQRFYLTSLVACKRGADLRTSSSSVQASTELVRLSADGAVLHLGDDALSMRCLLHMTVSANHQCSNDLTFTLTFQNAPERTFGVDDPATLMTWVLGLIGTATALMQNATSLLWQGARLRIYEASKDDASAFVRRLRPPTPCSCRCSRRIRASH